MLKFLVFNVKKKPQIFGSLKDFDYLCTRKTNMVPVVQLVRASDCGSECRRFEPDRAPPKEDIAEKRCLLFLFRYRTKFRNYILQRRMWFLRCCG